MRPTVPILLSAALLAAAASCGGGFGGAGAEFRRDLAREGLELPATVRVEEFRAACARISVTDPDALLKDLGVPLRGREGARYLSVGDLLGRCGPGCRPDEGLGELIRTFAVQRQGAR